MTEEQNKPDTTERAPRRERSMEASDNTVFIGKKPVMNYVLAAVTHFGSGSKKVVVKARGRSIPRAVDTVELLRRSFAKDAQVEKIVLTTEEVERDQGQKSRVSAIEIILSKA